MGRPGRRYWRRLVVLGASQWGPGPFYGACNDKKQKEKEEMQPKRNVDQKREKLLMRIHMNIHPLRQPFQPLPKRGSCLIPKLTKLDKTCPPPELWNFELEIRV